MAFHFGTVAQGKNILGTGAQSLVGEDATVGVQARFLGHADTRAQADGRQHHIGFQLAAIRQLGHQLATVTVVHRLGQRAKVELHTQILQAATNRFRSGFRQQQGQAAAHRLNQLYLEPTVGQVVGKFTADQTTTENGDCLLALNGRTEFGVVHQVVDGEHLANRVAFQRRSPGIGTQSQHQLAVIQVVIGQQHTLLLRIDSGHMDPRAHIHIELLGHLFRCRHAQVIGGLFLGKTGGQHGLGIVTAVVCSEHDDGRFLIQLAEFLDGIKAGEAGADDDNGLHE